MNHTIAYAALAAIHFAAFNGVLPDPACAALAAIVYAALANATRSKRAPVVPRLPQR